eukprot:5461475-Pyramimonas_sp.AAC.1
MKWCGECVTPRCLRFPMVAIAGLPDARVSILAMDCGSLIGRWMACLLAYACAFRACQVRLWLRR